MFSLPEEIYLFAFDKESGGIIAKIRRPVLEAALIGAVMSELVFLKRISIEDEYLNISSTDVFEEPVLDEVLAILNEAGKRKVKLDEALAALLAHGRNLTRLVLEKLLKNNVLQVGRKKNFWLFSEQCYSFPANPEFIDIDKKVHKLISGEIEPDSRDIDLIGLLHAAGLFFNILSIEEFKRYEERIEEIFQKSVICCKINELVYQVNDFPNYQSSCLTEDDNLGL